MGTTKDPEGFRRHTAGRGDVLGIKGGGPKRRGCGLGVALLVAALALAVAARVVLMRSDRDGRAAVAAAVPAIESAIGTTGPIPDDVPPSRGTEALAVLPESIEAASTDRRLPLTAASPEPESAGDSSALAAIRLLRGWSDAPFADAEVFWIGKAELARLRKNGLTITTVELEPVLRRLGRHGSSGPDGLLRVAADGTHLLVVGEGWTRRAEVRPDLLGISDVRVFAPRTLVVDVVDWAGAPVIGWPVELWRVDAHGQPQGLLYTLSTSSVTGSLRFDDVDSVLGPRLEAKSVAGRLVHGSPRLPEPPALERTRLRVALEPHLAPAAWAELDLADDPLPLLRLQLPPLGELHVLVAGSAGKPVAWGGRVDLRLAEGRGPEFDGSAPDFTQALAEGRATFGNLRFGSALRVRALRSDGAKGVELVLAPLTPDEPEREVVLSDVAPLPRLVLRPLHPDGFAMPRTWCVIHVQAHRPPSDAERSAALREALATEFSEGDGGIERVGRPIGPESIAELRIDVSQRSAHRTDAGGYLELPLPDEFLERTEITVVVSLVREGKTLSSTARRLERGETWADMDLGSVPLLRPSPPPEGSK